MGHRLHDRKLYRSRLRSRGRSEFPDWLLHISFVEYGIHRWWFHSPASFMTPSHLAHHANPRQPAALPCICSIVILPFVWWGFAAAFGLKNGSAALGGFLTGYVLYSVVHHMQHSVRVSRLPFKWMRRWWVSHAIHHGRRDANFGVTTPLWDYVLGTHTTHGRTRTSHDVTMRTDRADGTRAELSCGR